MRFKLIYSDRFQALSINRLYDHTGKYKTAYIPADVSEHVRLPVPEKILDDFLEQADDKLIPVEMQDEIAQITEEINILTQKRNSRIHEMRASINEILEKNYIEFRDKHAEHFL